MMEPCPFLAEEGGTAVGQERPREPAVGQLIWPSDVSRDRDRTRQALERLCDRGLLATPVSGTGVRDVIERSWRRCVGDGVLVAAHSIPYQEVGDLHPRLRAAATPVLDRFRDQLSNVRVAMFLSDKQGRIIMRRVSEPVQCAALDNASAAEGFDFSEDTIGTNGLGSVARERVPILVHGTEHYNETLEVFTCAGTPIFEPFTRQLLGTFALACFADDATPLMCAMATDVGRQIEGNLAAMLGAHERTLIQCYLLATRSDADPVIVVTEGAAFANTAGLAYVSAEVHAVLWTHLTEAGLRPGQHCLPVPLPAGWRDALVEHVGDSGPTGSAYCVRLLGAPGATLEPPLAPALAPARRTAPPHFAPRLHPLPDVDRQLRSAIQFGECLAVDGAPGTGKLHAAIAVLGQATGTAPRVVDFASPDSVLRFDDADSRAIVLRHLQDAPPRAVNQIKAAIGEAAVPVAVTVDLSAADEHIRALVAQVGTIVRLPSLREMQAQVPLLVSQILAELPAPRATGFSSEALQLLMRWSWPGNTAELRLTVEQVARRAAGRTAGTGDLPVRMQQLPPREYGMIESAERELIVTALRQASGNRTRAAAALGIGRTTLYRKLQTYGIRVARLPAATTQKHAGDMPAHGMPSFPSSGTWPTIASASSAYRLAIASGDSGPVLRYQVATAVHMVMMPRAASVGNGVWNRPRSMPSRIAR
jgi:hypothetical protein